MTHPLLRRMARALTFAPLLAFALAVRARARGRHRERLLDLARELGAADVRGVREGDRHQGQLRPLLVGRGARPRHRREEQSARRRAVRRPGGDVRRRHRRRRVRAVQAARRSRRCRARFRQADGQWIADRRRSARLHDQRQVPEGEQPQGARVVERPPQPAVQEHAADGRRAHLRHGGHAHLLDPRGQRPRRERRRSTT